MSGVELSISAHPPMESEKAANVSSPKSCEYPHLFPRGEGMFKSRKITQHVWCKVYSTAENLKQVKDGFIK